MGVNYDLQGFTPEAVREYTESLRYDEKAFAPHLRLGSNYARMGHYADAVKELKRASDLDPQDLQAHYFLALVHSAQQDFTSAANEYEFILKHVSSREPQNSELLVYLGQLYYSQGKQDKALEQFERAYQADPKNSEVAYLIGNFYLEQNRRAEAEKIFKSCIVADPFHDGCLNSLGYMDAEDGRNLDEAENLIRRAVEIDSANPAYIDSLGWVHYQKGQYAEALKELTRASEGIEDEVVYDHLGDVNLKLGHPDMAEKYWRMSLGLDPEQQSVKDKLQELGAGKISATKETK
jgi:tetratricopeptide (TPR) repeat protein